MKPKRKVSTNLGRTQHRMADGIYKQIRDSKGESRRCPFYGGKKYLGWKDAHDTINPDYPNPDVPIEEFDFCQKDGDWDLQSYCKMCYKVYRQLRIDRARGQWHHPDGTEMSDDEIRQSHRDQIGDAWCSTGEHLVDPSDMGISKSMETGLHNICVDCEPTTRLAQGLREKEWLAGGDWESWTSEAARIKAKGSVSCAGWPLSVQFGQCKGTLPARKIHLDHIVPLRAGGINDSKNLQPMCGTCNRKKSAQIAPDITFDEILVLIHSDYHHVINRGDSNRTIERKLKAHLVDRILTSIQEGSYEDKVRALKRRVNGQWDVERVVKKGKEWSKNQR